jgi:hypothetical protein
VWLPNVSVPVVTGVAIDGVNPPGLLARAGPAENRSHKAASASPFAARPEQNTSLLIDNG